MSRGANTVSNIQFVLCIIIFNILASIINYFVDEFHSTASRISMLHFQKIKVSLIWFFVSYDPYDGGKVLTFDIITTARMYDY